MQKTGNLAVSASKIQFLYLSEPDMIAAGVTDMRSCMDTMLEMFKAVAAGDYVMGGANRNSHGIVLDFPETSQFPNMPLAGADRRFMALPAYLGGDFDSVGVKWYGSNAANRERGLPRSIHLFTLADKETGAPLAVMSGNLLSAYRTGAIPGVAAAYLARDDARVLGVVGPGVMNRTSLEAILLARPGIDTLHVRGRGTASTDAFVEHAKVHFPQLTTIAAVSSIEAAVRGADIVAVATSSAAGVQNYPYLDEKWIKPGALVAAAATINLDKDFVANRARTVVDRVQMAEAYAAEMPAPAHHLVGTLTIFLNDLIAAGEFDRARIGDLGDIISGTAPTRRSDDEIILFGINGMPVEDVAWGRVVYANARARGLGTWLDLWDTPLLA